jgi:hypothetical protein
LEAGGSEATHETLKGRGAKRGAVSLSGGGHEPGPRCTVLVLPRGRRRLLLAKVGGGLDAEPVSCTSCCLLLSAGGGVCKGIVHLGIAANCGGSELGRAAHPGGVVEPKGRGELRDAASAGSRAKVVSGSLGGVELAGLKGALHCVEIVWVRSDAGRLRFWRRIGGDAGGKGLLGDSVGGVVDHGGILRSDVDGNERVGDGGRTGAGT